jgi:hypothetical protein
LTGGAEDAIDGADRHPMSRRESGRRDGAVEQILLRGTHYPWGWITRVALLIG